MWALFGSFCTAAAELRTGTGYAATIASLRRKLYLPQVSVTTGRLEERMSPDNLPALPDAWAASGFVKGVAARGGFEVDLRRRDGKPAGVRIHSVGGCTTTVAYGDVSRTVTLRPGASVTLRDLAR
ncbi:glycoside hydrolase family 95-like protein [Streptomyces sp. AC550_RSS872]|uniref:glycoside hydrolase family 95-like protein n=1 Tax=Streptomyces sp. AC550_RSS872 TaxID=2823689 RepID=UPI001C25CF0E|nr:hypothetical protein [Streptomyces sp. AC550_RSS872]